jgi:hypothetical protein
MKSYRSKVLLLVAVFAFAVSAAAGTIYSQPYDGSGNLFASQNDIGGNGNFATAYDDFTLTGNPGGWQVTDIHFTGGYFNPGAPGNITNFTLNFYAESGGIPGGLIQSFTTGNNANENCVGNICTYDAVLAGGGLTLQDGVEYWLSIEPDMVFPPQWGWATSAVDGDGDAANGYQCFFGSCGGVGVNFAFDLTGNPVGGTTPEPGTLVLLDTGVLGLAGSLRRKLF